MQDLLNSIVHVLLFVCKQYSGTLNHRMIEWFGLEETFKPIQFQSPGMDWAATHQLRLPRSPPSLASSITQMFLPAHREEGPPSLLTEASTELRQLSSRAMEIVTKDALYAGTICLHTILLKTNI